MPQEETAGGRREYDADHPLISLMEQRLLRAFEQGLTDTRHWMRGELAVLAATVTTSTERATQEHALVQLALVEIRGDVAELRTEISTLTPLKNDVAQLKAHEQADEARDTATDRLRRDLWRGIAVVGGLIISASGVLVAVLA